MVGDVLVVEDTPEMSELMMTYLELEGLSVMEARTAEAAQDILGSSVYDLIILDLNLPGIDGFEFLQWLRASSTVPVMIVSARDEDEDVVSALGIGADEYLTKPFSPRTLAARARALIRRNKGYARQEEESRIERFGPFELDLDSGILRKGKERIPIAAKEFSVLAYLIAEKGKPRSPEEIFEAVWDRKYGDITAVGVYIQRLRRKIESEPSAPVYILTDRGFGYRFESGTSGRTE
jgi:two-component system response regulator RegX3